MKRVVASTGRKQRAQALWARLEQLGPEAMVDEELLELLGVGPGAPPLFELARLEPRRLAEQLGPDVAGTLRAALELGRRALRARDVRPKLRTSKDAYLHVEPALAARPRERFLVLCLSQTNVLLANVLVAEGTSYQCLVDPRQVFAPAVSHRAASVILAHSVARHRMGVLCPPPLCGRAGACSGNSASGLPVKST